MPFSLGYAEPPFENQFVSRRSTGTSRLSISPSRKAVSRRSDRTSSCLIFQVGRPHPKVRPRAPVHERAAGPFPIPTFDGDSGGAMCRFGNNKCCNRSIFLFGTFFWAQSFFGRKPKEVTLKRRVDKEKIERADRESKIILEAERTSRDAKSARLKALRLLASTVGGATASPDPEDDD